MVYNKVEIDISEHPIQNTIYSGKGTFNILLTFKQDDKAVGWRMAQQRLDITMKQYLYHIAEWKVD